VSESQECPELTETVKNVKNRQFRRAGALVLNRLGGVEQTYSRDIPDILDAFSRCRLL